MDLIGAEGLIKFYTIIMWAFSQANPKYQRKLGVFKDIIPFQVFFETEDGYVVSLIVRLHSPVVKIKAYKVMKLEPGKKVKVREAKSEQHSLIYRGMIRGENSDNLKVDGSHKC